MPATVEMFGQPIEYIQDRLYLASYLSPPSQNTPFPNPAFSPRSPSKRRAASPSKKQQKSQYIRPVYFNVDNELLYNSFHADFGPFHTGHLYRFAVHFHEILGDPENGDRPVVLWTRPDPRSRANIACIVACYMVLIQSWPPHLALAPLAQVDPPYMPFRDAGCSQADFVLNIQDVVYGVWKAKEEGLCGLKDFSLEEYEMYERVDMGDFNWITPNFLAFASPQQSPVAPIPQNTPEFDALPFTVSQVMDSGLPIPFKNVLSHFSNRNVGLVVRLNSELYSPSYFTALGISHIDMIFDDGTCPPLPLVKRFIRIAHEMITTKNKHIAVHCKAGLGRTGCLIGAYLIYRHGFTANEIIAFMRFMRPGMVVGPQQHWLHLNQGTFREWWIEDSIKQKLAMSAPSTPSRPITKKRLSGTQTATPPNGNQSKRPALGEIDNNEASPGYGDENLPIPTPGQPRKTYRKVSKGHPYPRAASASVGTRILSNGSPRRNAAKSHANTRSVSEEETHALPKLASSVGTRSKNSSSAKAKFHIHDSSNTPPQSKHQKDSHISQSTRESEHSPVS